MSDFIKRGVIKINICFLLGGFQGNGGIGRVVSIISNKLCGKENYNIFTLSYCDTGKPLLYKLDKEVNQSYLFNAPLSMAKAMLFCNAVNRVKKYILHNNIDVIIACGALYYPLSILAKKGTKAKCICWEHSNASNSKDHKFQIATRKFGAKNADLVVTLTKQDQKDFQYFNYKTPIYQIYNPIDENVFVKNPTYDINSKKILSVGRLSYQKNFECLIEVANKILSKNPEWTLDIYGDGEQKEELQDKILKYKLQNKVFLKGQVNNLYDIYNNYSFLVMTSRYEGFPMTLLEGAGKELPLVSFDVLTGPNEVISNNENGYLITPFDIDDMVDKIQILIDNPEIRKTFSENNKTIKENFAISSIIQQWDSLLADLNKTIRSNR